MPIPFRGHRDDPAREKLPQHEQPKPGFDLADASPSGHQALARVYFASLVVVGAALFAYEAPRLEGNYASFALLFVLVVTAASLPISVYGESYVTVGFVVNIAMIILFGAPGMVIAAPFNALAGKITRKRLDWMVVPNAALFIVVNSAAAEAYGSLATINPQRIGLEMIFGALAATAVNFCLSAILLLIGVYLRTGEPLASSWEKHRWLAPQYAVLGIVGVALAASYIALGIAGIIIFVMPALMMRLTMKQYVDKTAENVKKLEDQNRTLEVANFQIRKVSDELRLSYDDTLEALVGALDARDQETKGHSVRVARYLLNIAAALGVKEGSADWIDMQRGALLHDVGKIGVRDSILLKPGKLTEEEWTEMRRHPEIGYTMLKEVKFLAGAAAIVLAHHERWDGKGYPKGLREDGIPLGSRIFSVVDTFDSMTSDRPYRRALSVKEAMNEILRCGGTQFDPLVVEAFLDIYEEWVIERQRLNVVELRAA